jgi:hypothetical protein
MTRYVRGQPAAGRGGGPAKGHQAGTYRRPAEPNPVRTGYLFCTRLYF